MDRDRRHRVPITEIEGLFKEHNRRNQPNIRPDDVCASILKAFNGDAVFIEQQLRQMSQQNMNVLSDELTLRFFQMYPGYQQYYQEDELAFFVDTFTRAAGRIELSELVEALNRVLRYTPNLKADPTREGIHKKHMDNQRGAGVESWTPIQSFS